jgi:hypothetical protein
MNDKIALERRCECQLKEEPEKFVTIIFGRHMDEQPCINHVQAVPPLPNLM